MAEPCSIGWRYRFDVLYGVPVKRPAGLVIHADGVSDLTLNGVRVIESALAVQHHVAFDVVRLPRKRRRSYVVKRRAWTTPSCFCLADGSIAMHPELVRQLRLQIGFAS